MRPERKFLDEEMTVDTIGQTGNYTNKTGSVILTTTSFCGVAQGSSASNRIGRKITVTNLHMKLRFNWIATDNTTVATAALLNHVTIRCMIFWDKQANGGLANALDLVNPDTILAFRDLGNISRFRVLYDKTWQWQAPVLIGAGTDGTAAVKATISRMHKDYIKKINLKMFIPIEYDNDFTDGRITTIRSNNIGMIFWSDQPSRIQVSGRTRLRYIDY